jgi:hypothetical protein
MQLGGMFWDRRLGSRELRDARAPIADEAIELRFRL